ncbi:MAG: accessory gene regulator B family protein [Lachnospiraceae bacterium]|nr:accessory gene regulator B family protein [Lachnospiraceae bacterium]
MALYRGVAERVVEIYDFDWQGNDRMKEVCVCSVENVIANGINVMLIAVLAFASGMWMEITIYFLTFAALRAFAGGAHAANHRRCITFYTCIMLVCIWSVKLLCPGSVLWTGILMLLGMLISGVTNYKYGAKQISIGNRRQSYRKKMFGIYGIICLMMLVMFVIYAETGAEMCRQVVLIQAWAIAAQGIGVFVGREECTM